MISTFKYFKLHITCFFLLGIGPIILNASEKKIDSLISQAKSLLDKNEPTVITTLSGPFNSFDPLDADYTRNLRIMRMLYATPLEKDINGKLSSKVLEKFEYSQKNTSLTLTLKKNSYYSDGSRLSIHDVKDAILRMAFSRPTFDPIKHIVGLDDWLKLKSPLLYSPQGIVTNELERTLTIHLKMHVNHPFERFTMEIFSIVPGKCIDKLTGKLNCEMPPFSGEYKLEVSNSPFFTFKRRDSSDTKLPLVIHLISMSPARIIKYIDHFKNNHVVLANHIDIPPEHRIHIEAKFRDNSIPEVRFFALVFNERTKTFSDVRVRQYFSKEYRKTLKLMFGREEGSILTKISPGYLNLKELYSEIAPFTNNEEEKILAHIRKYPPKWMKNSYANHDPFQIYLAETLKRLNIPESVIVPQHDQFKEMAMWKDGQFDIRPTHSGLDANDPTLDLKMMFTKNMHYFLIDLQNDAKLQEMLSSIQHTQVKEMDIDKLKRINLYLFERSIFSIVANYSIGQYTLKNSHLQFTNIFKTNISHYFTCGK